MMENYEFRETSSRNITENGEQVRAVSFRGSDKAEDRYDSLNVDGSFTMPMTEYFQAGVDGNLSTVIKNKVVDRLTTEEEKQEPTQ